MEIAFLLKKFIAQLIVPPFNLLLLALLGLLLMKRKPRFGRALSWSSLLGILLLATPAVAGFLLRSLDVPAVSDLTANNSAQAIVILGGGLRLDTPEYGDTLSSFTLDRLRYGATVARQTNLPVLASGGAVFDNGAEFVGPPEAEVMASVLRNELNVTVRWLEKQSRDTEDNLMFSGEMLKSENIHIVILVTHDFHMRRALAHCRAAGLICIPAPVSYAGRGRGGPWFYEIPHAAALNTSAIALHEIFGNLALVLRGK